MKHKVEVRAAIHFYLTYEVEADSAKQAEGIAMDMAEDGCWLWPDEVPDEKYRDLPTLELIAIDNVKASHWEDKLHDSISVTQRQLDRYRPGDCVESFIDPVFYSDEAILEPEPGVVSI